MKPQSIVHQIFRLIILVSTVAAQVPANRFRPNISYTLLVKELKENSIPGVVVALINVSDKDGQDEDIQCRNYDRSFGLEKKESNRYVLVSRGTLDREAIQSVAVSINCRDNGKPPLTTTKVIRIPIGDMNDNIPKFPVKIYEFSIRENNFVGDFIGQVMAADADAGTNSRIRFTLDGISSQNFHIDKAGKLSAKISFDREVASEYNKHITGIVYEGIIFAVDYGQPSLTGSVSFRVNIMDENDNRPQFLQNPFAFKVSRDAPMGSLIGELQAMDKDIAENAALRFSTVHSEFPLNQTYFDNIEIDSSSGALFVAKSLAGVRVDNITIRVRVSDSGRRPLSTFGKVVISLYDGKSRNKSTLTFRNSSYVFLITEDDKLDSFIGRVTAIDKEGFYKNSSIRYRLEGYGQNLVSINSTSGTIWRTNASLNGFADIVNLTVFTFVSKTSLNSSAPLLLNITRYPSAISFTYRFMIKENETIGTQIGRIQASGAEGISYHLDADSSMWLQMDNNTGILSTLAVLDREKMSNVNGSVFARLGSGLSASTFFQVDIEDVNDCTPSFRKNLTYYVNEGGHDEVLIDDTQATDCDVTEPNNNITYRLLDSIFSKNMELLPDGRLRLKSGRFDREATAVFNVTLVATDRGSPRLSSSTIVNFAIDDVNDNPPQWIFPAARNATVRISVDSPKGSLITQVRAIDADAGLNAKIEYSLITIGSPFSVDGRSGRVSTKRALRKKDVGLRRLRLMASDLGIPRMKSSSVLNIVVS